MASDEFSIELVLDKCLRKFHKIDKLSTYLQYLREEWYITIHDLKLAIDDGKSWSDLKLPGRLKLELKAEVIACLAPTQRKQWIKCFSDEHDCFYYYNPVTFEAEWEEPFGDIYTQDEWDDFTSKVLLVQTSTAQPTAKGSSHSYDASANLCISTSPPSMPHAYKYNSNQGVIPPYPSLPEIELPTTNSAKDAMFQNLRFTAPLRVDHPSFKAPAKLEDDGSESSDKSAEEWEEDDEEETKSEHMIDRLVEMGFSKVDSMAALARTNQNLAAAAALLVRLQPPGASAACERIPLDSSPRIPTATAVTSPSAEPAIAVASSSTARGGLSLNLFGDRTQGGRSSSTSSLVRRLGSLGRTSPAVTPVRATEAGVMSTLA